MTYTLWDAIAPLPAGPDNSGWRPCAYSAALAHPAASSTIIEHIATRYATSHGYWDEHPAILLLVWLASSNQTRHQPHAAELDLHASTMPCHACLQAAKNSGIISRVVVHHDTHPPLRHEPAIWPHELLAEYGIPLSYHRHDPQAPLLRDAIPHLRHLATELATAATVVRAVNAASRLEEYAITARLAAAPSVHTIRTSWPAKKLLDAFRRCGTVTLTSLRETCTVPQASINEAGELYIRYAIALREGRP